jgi:hypothetical protein
MAWTAGCNALQWRSLRLSSSGAAHAAARWCDDDSTIDWPLMSTFQVEVFKTVFQQQVQNPPRWVVVF